MKGESYAWARPSLHAKKLRDVGLKAGSKAVRGQKGAECMLVLIGATPEGRKELVGFQTGVRESAQSWRELLVDVKRRGLKIAPDIAVGDGALGFWKALDEVFPGTRHQRCWVHKTANVLNKVPLSVQVDMKTDLREIYGAPTRSAAEMAIDVFAENTVYPCRRLTLMLGRHRKLRTISNLLAGRVTYCSATSHHHRSREWSH
ncbi:transposase [Mesorhizobium sp. M1078]|uniref:transposase n=1 Tax=Mesorhizobium sp. M1078 TaxID=2957055 RepID=UPI003339D5C4